ncbi:MAG: hypothetical protein K9K62_06030 [Desulfobacteraceae bacterium]|nr:hypothetical protein [Desulfobacteraceae bacterium]
MNSAEIKRKLLHLVALCIPFGIVWLPRPTAIAVFVPLAGVMVAGEKIRQKSRFLQGLFFRVFGTFVRPQERHRITGGTYFFIAGAFCLVFFDKPVAYTVMSFMIIGDAAAALLGMTFGRIRLSSGKSLEGTLGCICACLIFWAMFPRMDFPVALTAAVLTGLLELVPFQIDDNLIVPLICGLALQTWVGW